MKKILWAFIALFLLLNCLSLSAEYTQWDVNAAESNLLALSWGDVFKERIDLIVSEISEEKKAVFMEKLPVIQKQYNSKAIQTVKDTYVIAIIDYLLVELWIQDGGQVIFSDDVVSVTEPAVIYNENTCDDFSSIMQFRNGKNNDGNVIPNTCDPSLADGIFSEYYETGKARFEIPIRDGRYDGIAKWYYENGTLEAKWEYDYGRITWEYSFYDQLWTLSQKNVYREDMSLQRIYYYANGQVLSTTEIKDGMSYGESEAFYSDGSKQHYSILFWSTPGAELKNWYKNGELRTHVLEDNTVLVDKPNLKIEYGDKIVVWFYIYDSQTDELLLWNYGSYIEEEVSRGVALYENFIGIEESSEKEFEILAELAYPESITPWHPWYGKTLRFNIFVYWIRR